jgi:type III secretory pathway component EscS
MAAFDGLLHHALVLTALLCLPVLGLATLVGSVVAVVQAAHSHCCSANVCGRAIRLRFWKA